MKHTHVLIATGHAIVCSRCTHTELVWGSTTPMFGIAPTVHSFPLRTKIGWEQFADDMAMEVTQ